MFGNAIHSFSSIVIVSSTLAINIGLLILLTMISNGSPVPSPCIRQSASAVLSQWRAALRPMSVDVSKPFRFRKVKLERVHIKTASKIIASMITERKTTSSLS